MPPTVVTPFPIEEGTSAAFRSFYLMHLLLNRIQICNVHYKLIRSLIRFCTLTISLDCGVKFLVYINLNCVAVIG